MSNIENGRNEISPITPDNIFKKYLKLITPKKPWHGKLVPSAKPHVDNVYKSFSNTVSLDPYVVRLGTFSGANAIGVLRTTYPEVKRKTHTDLAAHEWYLIQESLYKLLQENPFLGQQMGKVDSYEPRKSQAAKIEAGIDGNYNLPKGAIDFPQLYEPLIEVIQKQYPKPTTAKEEATKTIKNLAWQVLPEIGGDFFGLKAVAYRFETPKDYEDYEKRYMDRFLTQRGIDFFQSPEANYLSTFKLFGPKQLTWTQDALDILRPPRAKYR